MHPFREVLFIHRDVPFKMLFSNKFCHHIECQYKDCGLTVVSSALKILNVIDETK